MDFTNNDMFSAMVHGAMPESDANYFRQKAQNLANSLPNISDMGKQFIQQVNRVNSSEFLNKTKVLLNHVGNTWQQDTVRPLVTVEQLQSAQTVMQRWIAACPEARTMMDKQLCHGYEGTYVNMTPGLKPTQHLDYVKATIGIEQYCEETDETTQLIYDSDYDHDEEEVLTLSQKNQIAVSWDTVRSVINEGKYDFSNPKGGYL